MTQDSIASALASEAKRATPDHAILDAFVHRYSPYAFEPRPVDDAQLLQCLEAARWAASSFNEQPWSFLVARREDEQAFQTMLGCLVEANQQWARHAGVLMITTVKKTFTRNDKPNRVAEHDLGLAMGQFCTQAVLLGLQVHQMAGIELSKARQTYQIPESHEPFTGVALGHPAHPDHAAEAELGDRDRSPRSRKKLNEMVFEGVWSTPAAFSGT